MSTIFGPVYSRRFGASLGVDLSESVKQCNFDCLYCELAPAKAMEHQQIITPVETIVTDLQKALKQHPQLDVITITANGEPTMYPYLDELIEQITELKGDLQTLILSNSATLNDPRIFDALLKFDQVKLSLDAATPSTFKKIDRPADGIEIQTIIEAIHRFSKRFEGKLFIEILFVRGINDTPEEINALDKALKGIQCERIDIGTIDRPPAYPVEGLNFVELYSVANRFDPSLPIHIVSRTHAIAAPGPYSDEEILATLDKRPLTRDDIHALFDDASKERFQKLLDTQKITFVERSNIVFFMPSENIGRKRPKNPSIS